MGEGMVYGGLPFPDTGCPVPDVYIYYVPGIINVWDTVSTYIHLRWTFLHILYWMKDWIIQNGPPLYQIYIADKLLHCDSYFAWLTNVNHIENDPVIITGAVR